MDETPDTSKREPLPGAPAKRRLPAITGKTEAQVEAMLARQEAMIEARDEAAQTPVEVRRAFLPRRRGVGRFRFKPLCLGIIWIFEELKHPFNRKKETGRPLSVADAARAIFAFSTPEEAGQALEDDLAAFDAAAADLVAGIHPSYLMEISAEIGKIYADGMGAVPGEDCDAEPEPEKKDSRKAARIMPKKTSGIGWTLTLLDMMLHEYPWPSYTFRGEVRTAMDWVIWRLPLAKALALYSAIGPRYGKEPEADTYQAKAVFRAKRNEKRNEKRKEAAQRASPPPDAQK